MNRNRNDHLGEKVLWVLERNGRMMIETLAETLMEKPQAISVACISLHRLGKARPIFTGQIIRNRFNRKKQEVLWEIGPAVNIPAMPRRERKPRAERCDAAKGVIGITDEDLAWMAKYRQQREQRLLKQPSRMGGT